MKDLSLSFISHDWAGLPMAAVVLLAGWLGVRWGRRRRWTAALGYAALGLGALMVFGSLYHLVYMTDVRAKHPVPGKLVDVGGYRLHMLAEGEARGRPAIVWMPGGHSAGFYLHHLHRALRTEARSILIDRPGMGWSDIGPFPRTTPLESAEIVAALEGSGEKGPFVLAGHSFGGLLVANVARRRPDLVAAVVLIDATPPDAINYAPSNPFLDDMRRGAMLGGVQRLFGIHAETARRLWGEETELGAQRINRLVEERLGKPLEDVRAIEDGARSSAATASIYDELALGGLGWDAAVYDGELGDLPVYLVAPREQLEFKGASQRMAKESGANALQAQDMHRLQKFYAHSRERFMATSTKAQRVVAPSGTGHNFPYEKPEFVVETMRKVLSDVAEAP